MATEIRALHPNGDREPILFDAAKTSTPQGFADAVAVIRMGCTFERREVTDWVPFDLTAPASTKEK